MDMAASIRRASFLGRSIVILAGALLLLLRVLLPNLSIPAFPLLSGHTRGLQLHAFGSPSAPPRGDPRAPAVPQAVLRLPPPGVGAVAGSRQTMRPCGLDARGPPLTESPFEYGAAALPPAARFTAHPPAASASCASSFSSSPVSSFPAPPTSSSTSWSWPLRELSALGNLRAPLLFAAGAAYAAAPATRARTISHRGMDRRVGRRYVSCLRKR